jgi:hypothetical protein
MSWVGLYTGRQFFFPLSVKIQGDSSNFVIAESEYGNKTALSPNNIKGRD